VRFNNKVWFVCTRQETTSSVWQKPARGNSSRAGSAIQQIEPLTPGQVPDRNSVRIIIAYADKQPRRTDYESSS
jgi:hypothetical protein